jgi:hypothetical protein
MLSKKYINRIAEETVTLASEYGYVENLLGLSAIVEGIIAKDGIQIFIKNWRIHIRALITNGTHDSFLGIPVVVQTDGTFSDTVNIATRIVGDMLDGGIDDEFGFQIIGTPKCSRIKNVSDDGGIETHQVLEFTLSLPQNIIKLLNKESNTERLQSLFFGLVGLCSDDQNVFKLTGFYEIDFIERKKGITIR